MKKIMKKVYGILTFIPDVINKIIRLTKFDYVLFLFLKGFMVIIYSIPNLFIFIINKVWKKNFNYLEFFRRDVYNFIMILCFTGYLVGIFFLSRYFVQLQRSKKFAEYLEKSTAEIIEIESNIDGGEEIENTLESNNNSTSSNNNTYNNNSTYSKSYFLDKDVNYYKQSINNDVVAWIKVNNTSINYAVVQSSDNSYYLTHDLYKHSSVTGWVFGDYRNNMEDLKKNTIIYGHNMNNGTMFGTLYKVFNSWWYTNSNNQIIKLNTTTFKSTWRIFSIYKIEPVVDYLQTVFSDDKEYEEFISLMKSRSIYDFKVDVGTNDKILTLQTCDATGAKRVIVQAKLENIEYIK